MLDLNPLWLTALVSLTSAMVGGAFVHFLSLRRDRDAKRRDLVVSNLIEAWRALDSTGKVLTADLTPLERAMGDIQLFGNNKLIELAHKISNELASHQRTDSTELVQELLKMLRHELGLEPSSRKYFWFRFGSKENEMPKDLAYREKQK